MFLSLIIPVYNEEENLPILFDAVTKVMTPLKKPWEVIFVNDGSTGPKSGSVAWIG